MSKEKSISEVPEPPMNYRTAIEPGNEEALQKRFVSMANREAQRQAQVPVRERMGIGHTEMGKKETPPQPSLAEVRAELATKPNAEKRDSRAMTAVMEAWTELEAAKKLTPPEIHALIEEDHKPWPKSDQTESGILKAQVRPVPKTARASSLVGKASDHGISTTVENMYVTAAQARVVEKALAYAVAEGATSQEVANEIRQVLVDMAYLPEAQALLAELMQKHEGIRDVMDLAHGIHTQFNARFEAPTAAEKRESAMIAKYQKLLEAVANSLVELQAKQSDRDVYIPPAVSRNTDVAMRMRAIKQQKNGAVNQNQGGSVLRRALKRLGF